MRQLWIKENTTGRGYDFSLHADFCSCSKFAFEFHLGRLASEILSNYIFLIFITAVLQTHVFENAPSSVRQSFDYNLWRRGILIEH